MGMAAMIFLTIAAVGAAHATQIGVVSFANGSSTPQKIPARLVAQAQSAAKGHGHVLENGSDRPSTNGGHRIMGSL